jgi:hypothetical protein
MKLFFYTDGTDKFGPFTIEELKGKGITRDTMVWYEGLDDWKKAGEVPELYQLYSATPPPPVTPPPVPPTYATGQQGFTGSQSQGTKTTIPKNWLVESILVTLFCCLPFGIVGIVHASKVESLYSRGDYDGAADASAKAKKWTMLGFWIGIAVAALYFIFFILGAAAAIGF